MSSLHPILISGVTCSGKNHLTRILSEQGLGELLVSTTTRSRRAGEKEGVDYHFVSKERFEAQINQNKMVEHTLIDGEYYGVSFDALNNQPNPIAIVDPVGHKALREYLDALPISFTSVFLDCPSEIQERRLRDRLAQSVTTKEYEANARRWDSIAEERRWWQTFMDYHLYFPEFSRSTEGRIVESVIGHISVTSDCFQAPIRHLNYA